MSFHRVGAGSRVCRLIALGALILTSACNLNTTTTCPSAGVGFSPVVLHTGLAAWDGAQAVYDGASVWVAFSVAPLGSAQTSDIFLQHVTCDGTLGENPENTSKPIQINTALAEARRPALASTGRTILSAWSTLPPQSAVPQSKVQMAILDTTRTSTLSGPVTLVASKSGQPFVGDIQAYGVAGQSGSFANYMFAGARVANSEMNPSTSCETAFIQWVTAGTTTADGGTPQPTGRTIDAVPDDAAAGCVVGSPQLSAGSVREPIFLAWEQVPAGFGQGGLPSLLFSQFNPEMGTFGGSITLVTGQLSDLSVSQGTGPITSKTGTSARPRYLAFATIGATSCGAGQSGCNLITVVDMAEFSTQSITPPGQLNINVAMDGPGQPFVAGADAGGAVAWTTTLLDGSTTMAIQSFSYDGKEFTASGKPFDLSGMAASSQGRVESLAHTTGNSYVVVWSEPSAASQTTRTLRTAFVSF